MEAEGLPEAAVKAFEYSFNLLASGSSGMIPESDITVRGGDFMDDDGGVA